MSDFGHYKAELVVQTEDGEEKIPIENVKIEDTEDKHGFRELQLTGDVVEEYEHDE